MKKHSYIFLFILLAAISCKSKFETLRASTDPNEILQAAYNYYDEGEYLKAQTLFEQVIPSFRGRESAEDLFLKFAYTHYYLGEYILSAHYFKSFTTTYYNSPKREEASFMAAFSNYEMSPSHRLDQSYSEEAINGFQGFINSFPNSPRVDEANNLIIEMRNKMELKAYEQGKLYLDLGDYNAAIKSFESMLKDFPETQRAEEVRFLIIKSSYSWAVKSIYERRQERLLKTIELAETFKKRYDSSIYGNECNNIISQCKNDLKRFEND